MDPFEQYKGSDGLNNQILQNLSRTQATAALNQVGNEENTALVHEESRRMNWLLNKILQLLSIQMTISQDEELELLFAGINL